MPILTPAGLLIGVFIGDKITHLSFLIPWIFAFMTFIGSLGSDFKQLDFVIRRPSPFFISLLVLHIVMPFLAWGLGNLIFHGDSLTITGFILAVVIPTGVTSFLWATIYQGNLSFALAIILFDTLLSPFIVPASLSFFAGETVAMDVWELMKSLFFMIVFPSLLGMIINHATKGKANVVLADKLSPFTKIGVVMIVCINGGILAPYLTKLDGHLLLIIAAVFIISSTGYLISWFIGLFLKWERDVVVTMTFCSGMRNISAGSVLAVSFFPAQVALPVVLGMLFQQVLASVYGQLLYKYYVNKSKYLKV